jgi:glyoxylase-like metal-dependent hydrolase (beta-lactamase superfamily II)
MSVTYPSAQDPRQFVPATGQTWTSLSASQGLQKNIFETHDLDPRIHFITTKPIPAADLPASTTPATRQLGIGQRAILIQTPRGNVLWDLVAFIDTDTVSFINKLGGLDAIVISHPHFYTTHLEWARIFQCPVYVASDDVEWLDRADDFDGSLVLWWEEKLFIADTMMSVPVSFRSLVKLRAVRR